MYNSIDRQIICVDRLIQLVKYIPVQTSTFNYKVETSIRHLIEKTLPEDLANHYLENYWKKIKNGQTILEDNIEQRDLPYLLNLLQHLEDLRRP